MICDNCDHDVAAHGGQGCFVGSALPDESQHCECPFDNSGLLVRVLPAPCRVSYRTYTGRLVDCVHFAGHSGDHEGYYSPSDKNLSHWENKEKPVAVFGQDEVANPARSKYQDAVGSARDSQVGGDHYRKFKIQPWDIWEEYGLDPWLAGVVKYALRAGHKGSKLEDLRKARHYLDRAIEIEEGK